MQHKNEGAKQISPKSKKTPKKEYRCPRCHRYDIIDKGRVFGCPNCERTFSKLDCDTFDEENILSVQEQKRAASCLGDTPKKSIKINWKELMGEDYEKYKDYIETHYGKQED